MSLSKEHVLIISFFVLCLTFVNVASGNKMDNPEDIAQSLHKLSNSLLVFDQTTLAAPKSIRSLTKGLEIFSASAPLNIPVDAVYKAQTASDQALDNFHREIDTLIRWITSGMAAYTKLERYGERMSDEQVFASAQQVVNNGQSEENAALDKVRTAVNQLKDMQTNLNQINVRATDMKKSADFAEMVAFVLQLAQQDSQVGRDLAAELKKDGLISATVAKLPEDPVVKSKIIQAYLIVFRKTVGDTIESLSKLKVDGSESVAQAPVTRDGNNGQKGEDSRKVVLQVFSQLVETMKLFKSHSLPEQA